MNKIGFWEAAFKDINGWERKALNEAAESLAEQAAVSSSNSYGLQKLFALDRAQASEIARLRAAVEVMSTLLIESKVIDSETLGTRLEARIAELEAAKRPQQLATPGRPGEANVQAAEPVAMCSTCGEQVFARQTQITSNGTICDACYYKLQG